MKDIFTIEAENAAAANDTEWKYETTRRETVQAAEEFDHLKLETRAVNWEAFLKKDKARHKRQRAQDNKEIEIANQLFAESELNKATDVVNNLATIADNRMEAAALAKSAAMTANEVAFLRNALKSAKGKAKETKGKKEALDNERGMKAEAQEAAAAEAAKKNNTGSNMDDMDPDEVLEAAEEATDSARDDAFLTQFTASAPFHRRCAILCIHLLLPKHELERTEVGHGSCE